MSKQLDLLDFVISIYKKDDFLYGMTFYDKCIFKSHVTDCKVEYLGILGKNLPENIGSVTGYTCNEKYLYLVENTEKHILEYSFLDKKWKIYETDIVCPTLYREIYAGVFLHENNLYLFPRYNNPLIIFDIRDKRIQKISLWKENQFIFSTYKLNDTDVPIACFPDAIKIGDTVYLFARENGLVFIYDLHDDTWIVRYIMRNPIHVLHVIYFEKIFYILDNKGEVYTWQVEDSSIERLVIRTEIVREEDWIRIIPTEINIWFIPNMAKEIQVWNRSTQQFEIFADYPKDFQYYYMNSTQSKYISYTEDLLEYYFAMPAENYMLQISKKGNGRFKKINFLNKKKRLYQLFQNIVNEAYFDIYDLLKILNDTPQQKDIGYMSVGYEIYQTLRA